jgi:putative ABC transport system substrate-binding protein
VNLVRQWRARAYLAAGKASTIAYLLRFPPHRTACKKRQHIATRTAARSLKVEAITAPVHDDVEIETAIIALGREPGGGLVVPPDAFMAAHRASIISAAARNNVPAIYPLSAFARVGGLLSYAIYASFESMRGAATYVDCILRGAKPADLPVQFPAKFEMVVNLKTAKALGITLPQSILLRADEIIE